MIRHSIAASAAALTIALTFAAPAADAQYMRTGLTNTAAPRGDDNITPSALGFGVNYFGVTTTTAVVCMNGYSIMGNFAPASPCAYPDVLSANPPSTPNIAGLGSFYGQVIAPFYSDIRTNFAGTQGGQLQLGTGLLNGASTWAATWDGVRGYPGGNGATGAVSTFQLFMASLGAGNFIMEFNYGTLNWAAEGGIGFIDDGGATGSTFQRALGPATSDSRYCARFIGGVVTAEATNTGCLTAQFTVGTTVPEPTSIVLMASGLLALAGAASARRRRTES